ncbi:hypothetical protein INT44_009373 [Umbelopsis vinacea]|uniref:Uncharacterized protein n=1 Tax=Umbelopsis vinacea TaxID=44442 RepID=A0A8H7ULP3_9FUNG|nr:hypothetical protein INT44_009373 [Umbelopsis vinacea]
MRIKGLPRLNHFLSIHLSIVYSSIYSQWPARKFLSYHHPLRLNPYSTGDRILDVVKSADAAQRARADQAAVVPKARNEVTNENQSASISGN